LPHAHKEGWVCPHYSHDSTLLIEFSKAFKETGIVSVHNGFRHSYASHRLAVIKSADGVALEMNTSPRKLFQNYRELVTEKVALGYFDVFPVAKHPKRKGTSFNAKSRCGWQPGPRQERKEAPAFERGDGGLACSWAEDPAEHTDGVIGEERQARLLLPWRAEIPDFRASVSR
jgi:hypothetical protein